MIPKHEQPLESVQIQFPEDTVEFDKHLFIVTDLKQLSLNYDLSVNRVKKLLRCKEDRILKEIYIIRDTRNFYGLNTFREKLRFLIFKLYEKI
jgi:hypothetical protein